MAQAVDTRAPYSLWINRTDHILSFVETAGFAREDFTNYQQMMAHAVRLGSSGYRIQ